MSTRRAGTVGVLAAAAVCSWFSGCAVGPGELPQCTGRSVPINSVQRGAPASAPVTEPESDAQRQ